MKRVILSIILTICVLPVQSQSVGLVLSGGGAKGLSHLGVIKALEENNIPIDYIAGTSMGAIIGGLYAIGLTVDEMYYLFNTQEFTSWFKGVPEKEFTTYYFKSEPAPDIIGFNLHLEESDKEEKKKNLKVSISPSLISPYPMDLAVMQIFATASASAGNDFNNLMVPFFCVAADIVKKKPYIATSGDLGSAVRASMTYPFIFKPIVIDSTLLFDGGFYNNLPWDIMEELHNPDFILGVKCAGNYTEISEDDLIGQIESMITVETDYDIPQDKGLLIEAKYDVGIMDFDKIDYLIEEGYRTALGYIERIKERIVREISSEDYMKRRVDFRMKNPELKFDNVVVEGDFNDAEKSYITRTITNDAKEPFDFNQAKRGYYRIIASNTINTFYPLAVRNSDQDSLFTLRLRATKRSYVNFMLGANISSSTLNQGYLGMKYSHLGKNPWRILADVNVGHFYTGFNADWRQEISFSPLVFYEVNFNAHRFDYFSGNRNALISDELSRDAQENEIFMNAFFGTPLPLGKNMLAKVGFTAAQMSYDYFDTPNPGLYDIKDKFKFNAIIPGITFDRNTQNYKLYPTLGRRDYMSIKALYGYAYYSPGTTSPESEEFANYTLSGFQIRMKREHYFNVAKWLSLGYMFDFSYSQLDRPNDYMSTLALLPAFQPTVHSRSVLLKGYRAPVFVGAAISPVFKISETLNIHTVLAVFQPYKKLMMLSGGRYDYSEPFPRGELMANAAFVWHSPVGPISLSLSYYSGEETKWYPQFNIGYMLFKNKALEQ